MDVEVLCGDLLQPVPELLRGRVDLVVSNPPYVAAEAWPTLPGEVKQDPFEAVVGGTQLHARLVTEAPGWLSTGGWLVVEIGDDQGPSVRDLFEGAGLEGVDVLPDLAGRDRIVRGRRGPR